MRKAKFRIGQKVVCIGCSDKIHKVLRKEPRRDHQGKIYWEYLLSPWKTWFTEFSLRSAS